MQIWKFPITNGRPIEMPLGARILCVQTQHGYPTIWAAVDEQQPERELRSFCVYGTGWDLDDPAENYIGTYQSEGGTYIWHVFERK